MWILVGNKVAAKLIAASNGLKGLAYQANNIQVLGAQKITNIGQSTKNMNMHRGIIQ